ncbi:lysozyme inhibitor LprI family protein [Leptotrichia buccalis]
MKKKYLITKLVIILILSLVISCQNKNAELEKKIEKLEKENAEILQKQQNIQTNTVQANPENTETKKIEKTSQPKISNYENKVRSRIASYEAERDKVSDEYGWSPEETNANGHLNEKLDDELTKVYNLIMARLSESEKIEFRNKQRQWLKIRTKKVENSNNGEDGNPGMGGRAGGNVEIMTYQEFTKDRLIEFAKIYDNMN